jgi:hypothetical protein
MKATDFRDVIYYISEQFLANIFRDIGMHRIRRQRYVKAHGVAKRAMFRAQQTKLSCGLSMWGPQLQPDGADVRAG